MHQGQPGDRADADAFAGDVGDVGRDDDLARAAWSSRSQASRRSWVEELTAPGGEEDDVGGVVVDDRAEVVDDAEDRDARRRRSGCRRSRTGRGSRSRRSPSQRLPCQDGMDLPDVARGADEQHLLVEVAPIAQPLETRRGSRRPRTSSGTPIGKSSTKKPRESGKAIRNARRGDQRGGEEGPVDDELGTPRCRRRRSSLVVGADEGAASASQVSDQEEAASAVFSTHVAGRVEDRQGDAEPDGQATWRSRSSEVKWRRGRRPRAGSRRMPAGRTSVGGGPTVCDPAPRCEGACSRGSCRG